MKKLAFLFFIMWCFLLNGCLGLIDSFKIEDLFITYDGEKIVWDNIDKIDSYEIIIDNVTYYPNKNELLYNANNNFTINLILIKDGKTFKEITKTFTKINQVTSIKYTDDFLTWSRSEGATRYALKVNEKIIATDIKEERYNLQLTGNVSISIKPLSDSLDTFSTWSTPLTTNILASPKNITIDHLTNTITWQGVKDAHSYSVDINGKEYEVKTNAINIPHDIKETIVVKIKALSPSAEQSKYSSPKTFIYNEPIKEVKIEEGVIQWENNYEKYLIKINDGEIKEIEQNYINDLPSEINHKIAIYPIGSNDSFSNWYELSEINILKTPALTCNVKAQSEILSWDNIPNATHYHIKIFQNDKVIYENNNLETTTLYIGDICREVDDYQIALCSQSNIANYYESSIALLKVHRLSAPLSYEVSEEPLEKYATTVHFTSSDKARGFTITSEDVEVEVIDKTSFRIATNKTEQTNINIYVRSNGYIHDDVYYLDSTTQLTISLKRLEKPKRLTIKNGTLTWEGESEKYAICINDAIIQTNINQFPLELATGTHQISVRAIASNKDAISSPFSNTINIEKLATPENIQINDGILTWQKQNNKEYKITIDETEFKTYDNQYPIPTEMIKTTKTIIFVQALGDNEYELDSLPSQTLEIKKLLPPTNITLYNDTIRWIESENAQAKCYQLYDNDNIMLEVTNNMIQTSYFIEAKQYEIKVKAIGNQKTTFDSDYSNEVIFIKLKQIEDYKITGSILQIDPNPNGCGYEVRIDDVSYYFHSDVTKFSLPIEYKKLQIRVLGDDSQNIIKSDWKVLSSS